MSKKIAVIDGNSLMHRAYHAVTPGMNAPDGTPTNAVFGFMAMLLKLIETTGPDAVVCAFDKGRPAFRMDALERYKAQRPPTDEALKIQFPLIEDLLVAMDIPVVKVDGWEGDDILGTIAARNEVLGFETLLVTGDKDAYQLATDLTQIVTTKKGITDVVYYGPAQVEERYGITPEQIPDFLGLKGDASDNIPGVPGIGEKTATKLLQQFGSLEGLYENLDELKGKQLENVRDNKEAAFLSRQVATIVCDLDFPLDLESVRFPSYTEEAVKEAFEKIRFTTHLKKVIALIGGTPIEREIDTVSDMYEVASPGSMKELEAALEQKEWIGLAFQEDAQTSLFEPESSMAVHVRGTTVVYEGLEAKQAFARIVERGRFAMLDIKESLRFIYPADTSLEALVSDEAVFAMDAFDLGLAGYVLDSSLEEYGYDSLLATFTTAGISSSSEGRARLAAQATASVLLREHLAKALDEDGSADVFYRIDMPLVGVLTLIERTGALIDVESLKTLSARTAEELETLRAQIWDLAGEEFNVDSPKQLSHILFDVIGLKPSKKTQTGFSTNAAVLRELEEEHELPGLILRYRELAKIKSTYMDALPRMRAQDGRIHTTFHEKVTTTGRLSSSDPNLQNIPVRTDFGRQIRECFVPLAEGEAFLSADYSQIELRLLAHMSEDEGLIDAFCSGTDFHAQTASRVFGIDFADVTPDLRSRAKAVNFGIVYGQQAFGLSQSLRIPFVEAKEMIDRYFEVYPQVRIYLDEIVENAHQEGFATTMFGRKRHIPELRSKNPNQRGFGERTAMNHPMQGSAADIIKLAMTQVQKRIFEEGLSAKMILQVHDELDFSVPRGEIETVSSLVKDIMESIVSLRVPLVVDVSHGNTWAQAH